MDREDIFNMAEDAGLAYTSDGSAYPAMYDHVDITTPLERFAALVAAKAAQDEREACASVADAERWNDVYPEEKVIHDEACQEIAAAIRARGQ